MILILAYNIIGSNPVFPFSFYIVYWIARYFLCITVQYIMERETSTMKTLFSLRGRSYMASHVCCQSKIKQNVMATRINVVLEYIYGIYFNIKSLKTPSGSKQQKVLSKLQVFLCLVYSYHIYE